MTRLSPYRWAILAGSFAVLLTSFIVRLAWGNAAGAVGQTLGLGPAALGAFVTAFYLGYVIANALGGFLADRFGPRLVIVCAMLPLGLFTFSFSLSHSASQGLAVQFAMGIASGVFFSTTTKIITAWFPTAERGRAFGVLAMASSIAVLIANSIFPELIVRFSWGTLYRMLGLYALALGLLCWVVLRNAPAEGAIEPSGHVDMNVRSLLGLIFGNRAMLLLAMAGFGANWGTWGFAFWSNTLMVKGHGITPVAAGRIVALFGMGAIFAKPLYGLLSDLIGGRRKGLVIVSLASFVVMLLVFGSRDSEAAFRLCAPFLGIAAFVYSPLMSAMISELMGAAAVGAAAGLTNAFWQCGNAIVPLVVGYVFSLTHSFMAAFVVLACGPFVGALCMLFVIEPPRRPAVQRGRAHDRDSSLLRVVPAPGRAPS